MKKYKIPVYAETIASMHIGNVECDSYDEFLSKRADLWDEKDPSFPNYACNPFDLFEAEMSEFKESDMKHYKNDE